jgi:hypothetical protein
VLFAKPKAEVNLKSIINQAQYFRFQYSNQIDRKEGIGSKLVTVFCTLIPSVFASEVELNHLPPLAQMILRDPSYCHSLIWWQNPTTREILSILYT